MELNGTVLITLKIGPMIFSSQKKVIIRNISQHVIAIISYRGLSIVIISYHGALGDSHT